MSHDSEKLPELVPLHRLPDLIPSSRRGKKLALATIYRWCQQGRIPTLKVGGGRYVTAAALASYLTPIENTGPLQQPGRQIADNAGAELDRLLSKCAPTACPASRTAKAYIK